MLGLLPSCAHVKNTKLLPEYKGVDPKVRPIVDEYLWLSTQNNIVFTNIVTIGFKHINRGDIVGLTTYGSYFREIDIDIDYWNHSTKITKMTLLYHELSHAYCHRKHDYGKNLPYPEEEATIFANTWSWHFKELANPGYYTDGCPLSIMYPIILSNDCIKLHYNDYTKEMFDRCDRF